MLDIGQHMERKYEPLKNAEYRPIIGSHTYIGPSIERVLNLAILI